MSGIGSLIVAALAFWFTVSESRKARNERAAERIAQDRERRLLVRPVLTGTWVMDQRAQTLRYTLRNLGVGPAKIMACHPVYRGQPLEQIDLQQLVNDFEVSEAEPGSYCPQIMSGTPLPVGESMVLLDLTFTKVPDGFDVVAVRDAISFEARYQSIYGDEFTTQNYPL